MKPFRELGRLRGACSLLVLAGCAAEPLAQHEDVDVPLAHASRAVDPPVDVDAAVADARPCVFGLVLETESGARDAVLTPSIKTLVLNQWVENRSAEPQILRYPAPCHGNQLTGLGRYDSLGTCLKGMCAQDDDESGQQRIIAVPLAPGERINVGPASVYGIPAPCQPKVLAPGAYEVSYQFDSLGEATTCVQPFHLTVRAD